MKHKIVFVKSSKYQIELFFYLKFWILSFLGPYHQKKVVPGRTLLHPSLRAIIHTWIYHSLPLSSASPLSPCPRPCSFSLALFDALHNQLVILCSLSLSTYVQFVCDATGGSFLTRQHMLTMVNTEPVNIQTVNTGLGTWGSEEQ